MKKFFTLTLIVLSFELGFSQNLQFTTMQNYQWGDATTDLVGRAYIKNTGSDTLYVKVQRNIINQVQGSQNSFCWDLCYGPLTGESQHSLAMPTDSVLVNFYADYFPNGNTGLTTIQYCFYDENNVADSACIMMYFNSSPTGIESYTFADANTISQNYPNPAAGQTKVNYSLKSDVAAGKIELRNVLGSLIKVIDLKEKAGAAIISLGSFTSGIYFYSLVADGKTIATKQLVVTN